MRPIVAPTRQNWVDPAPDHDEGRYWRPVTIFTMGFTGEGPDDYIRGAQGDRTPHQSLQSNGGHRDVPP